MDIKGGKPVANREKQRPLGAKTKTHFSGQTRSTYIESVQRPVSQPALILRQVQAPVSVQPVEHTNFSMPRYEAPEHPKLVMHKRRSRRVVVFRSVAMCLIVFVTAWGLLLWNGYLKFHKVFHGSSIVAALSTKPTSQLAPINGETNGRVNVLLTSTGDANSSKSDVTDSIMLMSVDTQNNTATVVTLPPDLWVQQPVTYYAKEQKIDRVYQYGKEYFQTENPNDSNTSDAQAAGISGLDQVVERVTGEPIDYNILINFQGFQQAVDAVGDISINVPTELKDPSLAYFNHGNSVIAQAGAQTMNGAQALLYARSHVSTSNFASLQRQLQILVGLKDKVLTAGVLSNPEAINSLTNVLDNNFYTDFSTEGAERFYQLVQKINDNKVTTADLMGSTQPIITTSYMSGVTALLPDAGYNDYAGIQEYVRGLMPVQQIVSEGAPITVISKTQDGAQLTANYLKSYGYDVTSVQAASQQVKSFVLVDLSNGQDPQTLKALESHYHIKAVTQLPAGIDVPQGSAKFAIIEP